MRYKLRSYFIWTIWICSFLQSFSQSKIQGKITLDDGENAVGALVSLVSIKDSITPIDFVIAGEQGKWIINTNAADVLLLKAGYLGYQDHLEKIVIKTGDSLYYDITLEKDPVLINEIEIIAKTIDFTQKGDTLRFNLKNKIYGGSETLGEVLERLPGFEIDENSQILYNGKKIDKLLIEGKDILNDQHQLANEGINSEDLLAVDIINHYKDKKILFSGEDSDKIALNVDLDNQNRSIWSGNIESGIGVKNKYKASSNIIGVGSKYGITIFGKGNNTGEPVITSGDYLSLLSHRTLLRKLDQARNLDNLIPSSLLIPKDLRENNDWLIAMNTEYSINSLKLNISLSGVRLSRLSTSTFTRNYVGENDLFFGTHEINSTLPVIFNLQSNIQYQWKERMFFEIDFPISTLSENNTQIWTGNFNNDQVNIVQTNEDINLNTFPRVYIDYKISPKMHLKYEGSFGKDNNDIERTVTDINTLFNSDHVELNQVTELNESYISNDLSFYKEIKNTRIGIDLKYYTQKQKLDISTRPDISQEFDGIDQLDTRIKTASPFWRLKTDKWLLKARVNLSQYQLSFNGKTTINTTVNPKASIRYNFKKLHFLLFSIGNRNTTTDITNVTGLSQIEDGQTIRTGSIKTDVLPYFRTLTMTYVNFHVSSRTLFNMSLSSSNASNIISSSIINEERFAQISSVIQPIQSGINGQILISKPILNGKWKFSQKAKYHNIKNTIIQNGESEKLTLNKFNTSTSLNSITKGLISYKIGVNLSYQNQSYATNLTVLNNIYTVQPKGGLTFKKNDWSFKNTFLLSFQRSRNINLNGIAIWGFDVTYSPKSKPHSLSLIGANILNRSDQEQTQLIFNPVFIEQRTYFTFPSFLILQYKYRT